MTSPYLLITVSLVVVLTSGCVSYTKDKGEVLDSAPTTRLDPLLIEDAVVIDEPITRAGNIGPYTRFGVTYTLLKSAVDYREQGLASWYGSKFHGRKTSNGEIYDMYAMTAAHKTLPIPTYVRVTNLDNKRSAIVRINDRGPFHEGRIIDLSYAAATKLGVVNKGTANVEVVTIGVNGEPLTSSNTTVDEKSLLRPWLQVASFSSQENAQRLRDKLSGFFEVSVVVFRQKSAAGVVHRVMLGPLVDDADTEIFNTTLSKQGLFNTHVIYQ